MAETRNIGDDTEATAQRVERGVDEVGRTVVGTSMDLIRAFWTLFKQVLSLAIQGASVFFGMYLVARWFGMPLLPAMGGTGNGAGMPAAA